MAAEAKELATARDIDMWSYIREVCADQDDAHQAVPRSELVDAVFSFLYGEGTEYSPIKDIDFIVEQLDVFVKTKAYARFGIETLIEPNEIKKQIKWMKNAIEFAPESDGTGDRFLSLSTTGLSKFTAKNTSICTGDITEDDNGMESGNRGKYYQLAAQMEKEGIVNNFGGRLGDRMPTSLSSLQTRALVHGLTVGTDASTHTPERNSVWPAPGSVMWNGPADEGSKVATPDIPRQPEIVGDILDARSIKDWVSEGQRVGRLTQQTLTNLKKVGVHNVELVQGVLEEIESTDFNGRRQTAVYEKIANNALLATADAANQALGIAMAAGSTFVAQMKVAEEMLSGLEKVGQTSAAMFKKLEEDPSLRSEHAIRLAVMLDRLNVFIPDLESFVTRQNGLTNTTNAILKAADKNDLLGDVLHTIRKDIGVKEKGPLNVSRRAFAAAERRNAQLVRAVFFSQTRSLTNGQLMAETASTLDHTDKEEHKAFWSAVTGITSYAKRLVDVGKEGAATFDVECLKSVMKYAKAFDEAVFPQERMFSPKKDALPRAASMPCLATLAAVESLVLPVLASDEGDDDKPQRFAHIMRMFQRMRSACLPVDGLVSIQKDQELVASPVAVTAPSVATIVSDLNGLFCNALWYVTEKSIATLIRRCLAGIRAGNNKLAEPYYVKKGLAALGSMVYNSTSANISHMGELASVIQDNYLPTSADLDLGYATSFQAFVDNTTAVVEMFIYLDKEHTHDRKTVFAAWQEHALSGGSLVTYLDLLLGPIKEVRGIMRAIINALERVEGADPAFKGAVETSFVALDMELVSLIRYHDLFRSNGEAKVNWTDATTRKLWGLDFCMDTRKAETAFLKWEAAAKIYSHTTSMNVALGLVGRQPGAPSDHGRKQEEGERMDYGGDDDDDGSVHSGDAFADDVLVHRTGDGKPDALKENGVTLHVQPEGGRLVITSTPNRTDDGGWFSRDRAGTIDRYGDGRSRYPTAAADSIWKRISGGVATTPVASPADRSSSMHVTPARAYGPQDQGSDTDGSLDGSESVTSGDGRDGFARADKYGRLEGHSAIVHSDNDDDDVVEVQDTGGYHEEGDEGTTNDAEIEYAQFAEQVALRNSPVRKLNPRKSRVTRLLEMLRLAGSLLPRTCVSDEGIGALTGSNTMQRGLRVSKVVSALQHAETTSKRLPKPRVVFEVQMPGGMPRSTPVSLERTFSVARDIANLTSVFAKASAVFAVAVESEKTGHELRTSTVILEKLSDLIGGFEEIIAPEDEAESMQSAIAFISLTLILQASDTEVPAEDMVAIGFAADGVTTNADQETLAGVVSKATTGVNALRMYFAQQFRVMFSLHGKQRTVFGIMVSVMMDAISSFIASTIVGVAPSDAIADDFAKRTSFLTKYNWNALAKTDSGKYKPGMAKVMDGLRSIEAALRGAFSRLEIEVHVPTSASASTPSAQRTAAAASPHIRTADVVMADPPTSAAATPGAPPANGLTSASWNMDVDIPFGDVVSDSFTPATWTKRALSPDLFF